MIDRGASIRLFLCGLIAIVLGGCAPTGGDRLNEEKDPHFLTGKSRISSLDYDGAILAFEKALESNPRSAAAHLELGLLYEEKKKRYATAIYHFEKHLDLRPSSNYAEMVNQHIINCKLELARTVSFALVSHQVQDELRRLNSTNALLREQILQHKSELAHQATVFSNRLAAAMMAAVQSQRQSHEALHPISQSPQQVQPPPRRVVEAPPPRRVVEATPRVTLAPARYHSIRPGDTMASIARTNGIRLDDLMAANPGVDPRKLKQGQLIRLPERRN
jgi:hypothetical protein